ncbi:hypothetical protein L917_08371 [Phytophthora nicotianae]|uniref:Uncharacterized protein n=1 Tax=Phytophthora nicotianae TaxID=4792 RepID=W2L9K5_PHYNI|nr:hypothetical protein L917_08371 [Phytophthora nicotianae]
MEWMPSCRKENRVKVLLGYLADFFQSAAIKVHNDALVLHHVRDNLRRIEKHSTMSKYLAAGADIIKVAGFEKACEVSTARSSGPEPSPEYPGDRGLFDQIGIAGDGSSDDATSRRYVNHTKCGSRLDVGDIGFERSRISLKHVGRLKIYHPATIPESAQPPEPEHTSGDPPDAHSEPSSHPHPATDREDVHQSADDYATRLPFLNKNREIAEPVILSVFPS